MKPPDNLRPPKTVEVECSKGCGWSFWVEALDPRLPDGPFICDSCTGQHGPVAVHPGGAGAPK